MTTTLDAPAHDGVPVHDAAPQHAAPCGGRWRRGRVVALLALLTALVLDLHAAVPNRVGNLGSLVETFLPWFGLAVPVLLPFALARRSALALVALVLPVTVWLSLFAGTLTDKRGSGGDLTVVSHNVDEQNRDPARTAHALAASGADILAVEELGGPATGTYEDVLGRAYPYHSVQGTVGLWSRYPMSGTEPVPIMPWTRALRSTVHTPEGPVAVFVAHLASVRVGPGGFTADARDDAALRLAAALRRAPAATIVLGDFNGTTTDGALAPVVSRLRSAQDVAGAGFGFTWPAAFPVARIDQILVRGVRPVSAWTLPATGSDHLPVAARLDL
jgi:vancomycin resistance protein VanJ